MQNKLLFDMHTKDNKTIRRRWIAVLLLALLSTPLVANDLLTLEVQVPNVVSTGEMFRLTFVTNKQVDNFTPPSITGISIIAGPATSTNSAVNIINGRVTQSTSVSYTYTLLADKEGKYTIGAAKVSLGSDQAQSREVPIEVVKAAEGSPQQQQSASVTAALSDKNLFIAVTPTKKEVYIGESLLATTKLYSQGNEVADVQNWKLPTFVGFWAQDMQPTSKNIEHERENVNGSIYDAWLLSKQLLVPQQAGDLVINPAELDVLVRVRTRSRDVFDDFFSGGGYPTVTKSLKSKPVTIKVKKLPVGAPASFSGGVGTFSIEGSISRNQLMANEALNYTIKISGKGNLKLINAPKVAPPLDFDVYDTKSTDQVTTTESGMSGSRTFDIPLIPRSAGQFVIPPVEFSFFNTQTGQYVTLRTKEYTINVDKDTKGGQTYVSGSSTDNTRKEAIKHLGQDIRFIKVGNLNDPTPTSNLIHHGWFYALYILVIGLVVAAYAGAKKTRRNKQNIVRVKNKKANKIAKKRLATAAGFLKAQQVEQFYDELARAMWGYLSNKLNIPVAELSRDAAKSAFEIRGIEAQYIDLFLHVVDECEFARYAPGSGQLSNMQQVYSQAGDVISKLEQRIK